jgi:MFS superfamily sulfate permease-like transporter
LAAAGPDLKWFVLDALPITQFDSTAIDAIDDVAQELRRRGAELVLAGRVTQLRAWRDKHGVPDSVRIASRHYPTMKQALRAYRELRTPCRAR